MSRRIVLFCGGRGSATIIRALLAQSEVELTLLVNAYDDGLSTGVLRNFIPGMLGPSDFRKNLSYLFGDYSPAQYALQSLMEYRLSGEPLEIEKLACFATSPDIALPDQALKDWFAQLPHETSSRIRTLLARFFGHAAGGGFDYRDCSLGNLVFAGAYLEQGNDFNAAAAAVAALGDSHARLFNVSEPQNRVLIGLKQDGTLLASEAAIVGPQSMSPITDLYLLEQPLAAAALEELATLDTLGKQAWLSARDAVPKLSGAAAEALAGADIILYGPGTQHSSLFPSYRIARAALEESPAPIKALVINLESDNDIQNLSAGDIVDRALGYGAQVSHILLDEDCLLPPGSLTGVSYRGARIARAPLSGASHPRLHDGAAVSRLVMELRERSR
jgi:2-phospho-L-lactate transferase/gluconeogenesis factor (CofD/UPF0052 family)